MNKGLLALFLVCLSITSLTVFELVTVLAISAPTINTKIEPGMAWSVCDYILYIDGTSVLAWNARGGGNDYSGSLSTSDTVFQSSFNALTSGGAVCAKGGTYTISAQVVMKTNTALIGEPNTVLKASNTFPASQTTLLSTGGTAITNSTNILIEGVTLDGNYPTNTNIFNLLTIAYGNNITVQTSGFRNNNGHMIVSDPSNVDGQIISGNFFNDQFTGDSLIGFVVSRSVFSNNILRNVEELTTAPKVNGAVIDSNVIIGNKGYAGFSFEPQSGGGAGVDKNIVISNNILRSPTGTGVNAISFGGSPGALQFVNNTSVVGNLIEGYQIGILGTSVQGALISGNTIRLTTQNGISFQDSVGIDIVGNTIIDASSGGAADYGGITLTRNAIAMTDILISQNVVYDDRVVPKMPNCITLDDGVGGSYNRISIIGNRLNGCATLLIRDNVPWASMSNLIVRDNPGYNPKGVIASPFENTNFVIGPFLGAAALPTSTANDYLCGPTDLVIVTTNFNGGTITVKDAAATTIISGYSLTTTPLNCFAGWKLRFVTALPTAMTVTAN